MLSHGTANVRVRTINPGTYDLREPFFVDARPAAPVADRSIRLEKAYPTFHPVIQQTRPVYLQVGAFRNKQYAVKLQKRIGALSKAKVTLSYPSGKRGLYKVKVGPLRDVASVARITSQLKSIGMIPSRI